MLVGLSRRCVRDLKRNIVALLLDLVLQRLRVLLRDALEQYYQLGGGDILGFLSEQWFWGTAILRDM